VRYCDTRRRKGGQTVNTNIALNREANGLLYNQKMLDEAPVDWGGTRC